MWVFDVDQLLARRGLTNVCGVYTYMARRRYWYIHVERA